MKWTLKTKLLSAMMLVTAIGVIVVSVAFISTSLSQYDAKLQSRLAAEIDLLSENIGAALMFRDQESATEMLATLAADQAIVGATLVVGSSGDVLARYQRETVQSSDENRIIVLRRAVQVSNEELGYLELQATTAELREQGQRLFEFSVLVLLLAIVLVFLVAWKIQQIITQPVMSLIRLSRDVASSRNYNLRSDVQKTDEIGELASQFNQMLEQIQQRDLMLEREVRQRTAELEKLAEEFRYRAFHDALTGLPNRALLNEYFMAAAAHADRSGSRILLLLLDLDNFKTINDSLGHGFGDELLKSVAKKLKSALREEDLTVRLGGDEFVVLVEHVADDHHAQEVATSVADKILHFMQDEIAIDDKRIKLTASIGGSFYPQDGSDLGTLKRNADMAMYSAKAQGRNRFSMFSAEMESSTVKRLTVQNDLRVALATEQLKLVFQPKVDALNGNVVGCEVLVRWQHPLEGFMSPALFIPFAEENGMIRDLDYYVLDRACVQARLWRDIYPHPIPVAVNLSPMHFSDLSIVDRLREALDNSLLPPQLLEVEITEAMLINDPEQALVVLAAIRELGVRISLDDFGVGYSSLSYLRTLPVDVVKLDRSFVTDILDDPKDERLTRGIVALARGLKLGMVAEGVETAAQRDHLLEIGCHVMQGYFFLRPCPVEDFTAWLLARGNA